MNNNCKNITFKVKTVQNNSKMRRQYYTFTIKVQFISKIRQQKIKKYVESK